MLYSTYASMQRIKFLLIHRFFFTRDEQKTIMLCDRTNFSLKTNRHAHLYITRKNSTLNNVI